MKGKKIVSTLLALLLLTGVPVSALAAEWDISKGDITVNAGSGGQTVTQGGGAAVVDSAPVIMGSSTDNTLTINAEKDQTASVTLSGVNIDVSGKGKAAVSTTGEGNVSIELDGDSTLMSGEDHAGLEKNNGGSLTIADQDENGKLTAEGGDGGAGIGGGIHRDGLDLAISGGDVKATGGAGSAGIGGGDSGAGIGGGSEGNGNNIAISSGEVTATSNGCGAGIGGGGGGDGSDITVSGDAKLKVQGGVGDGIYGAGAGIGNGGSCDELAIPVTGAEVVPDTSGLTTNGSIEYYAPGAYMENDTPTSTTTGKPTEPTEPEQPEAKRGAAAPPPLPRDRQGQQGHCLYGGANGRRADRHR